MRRIPDPFLSGPFSRRAALDAGISARVLEGAQFRRVHEAVYVHRDHDMTWQDRVLAARLALPEKARTTGVTLLQQIGVDVGSRTILHFVVEGDLHLVLDGVFLHRTVKMPPCGDLGVSVEAAYVAFCADARLIDAVRVGCFLLHEEHLDGDLLDELLTEQGWRRGSAETSYVLPYLDARPWSLPEAELLQYVLFAGLPAPEVNEGVVLGDGTALTPDLWFEDYRVAVEYEGGRHQDDRGQYVADIDRYAAYRRNGVAYEQVTRELMRSPRATVRRIHALLAAGGYAGPPPTFDGAWSELFARLEDLVRQRRAA